MSSVEEKAGSEEGERGIVLFVYIKFDAFFTENWQWFSLVYVKVRTNPDSWHFRKKKITVCQQNTGWAEAEIWWEMVSSPSFLSSTVFSLFCWVLLTLWASWIQHAISTLFLPQVISHLTSSCPNTAGSVTEWWLILNIQWGNLSSQFKTRLHL